MHLLHYYYMECFSFHFTFQTYVPAKWVRDVRRFNKIGFTYNPSQATRLSFLRPLLT